MYHPHRDTLFGVNTPGAYFANFDAAIRLEIPLEVVDGLLEERFAIHQEQGLARYAFGLEEDAYTFAGDERLTAARRNHNDTYAPPEECLNGLALVDVLTLQPFVDLHRPRQLEVVVRQPILAPGGRQFLQQRR